MIFQLRRYYFGLVKYKMWLLIFLIPPVIFLAVTAMIPSKFIITQDVKISADTPIALMASPTATMPTSEFVQNPEELFLNPFTLRALYTKLHPGIGNYRTDPQFKELADSIKNDMALKKINPDTLQIHYSGPDRMLGNFMVGFFSEQFVRNAAEGIKRSRTRAASAQKPNLIGKTAIIAQRVLLPSMYIPSFLQMLIASLLGALLLAGILEFKDSSFKSERQMAEYLGLPILGSLPNLNRVYSAIEK